MAYIISRSAERRGKGLAVFNRPGPSHPWFPPKALAVAALFEERLLFVVGVLIVDVAIPADNRMLSISCCFGRSTSSPNEAFRTVRETHWYADCAG
jgi:hypothetical protein